MTEVSRLSVAIEATGLDKATADMAKLEKAGEKAAATVKKAFGGVERDMAALQGMFDRATGSIVGAITKLEATVSKGFAGTAAAMGKIGTGARTAEKAVDQAAQGIGGDMKALEAIADRAASQIAAAMARIAPATNAVKVEIAQSAQSMTGFETAAASMAQATENLQVAIRETAEAQAKLNEQFQRKPTGGDPYKPQAESLDALRAKFNPLFAIGQRYKEQVEEIRAAHAKGAIGVDEMNSAMARASQVAEAQQDALLVLDKRIANVGDRARLTSSQMLNLSRQGNDALTMYFSGSDWSQILATQAGQIYGALEEGPQGVRGSLAAIRDSAIDAAKAIGPIGIALGVAATAAAGLWFVFRDKVKPIDDLLKEQAESVKALSGAYNLAAESVEGYARRSAASLQADVQRTQRESMQAQVAAAQSTLATFAPFDATGLSKRSAPAFAELKAAADAFRASIAAGNPDFRALDDAMSKISTSTADVSIRKFADQIIASIQPNVQLQGGIADTARVMDDAAISALRLGEAYREAMATLNSLVPDLRTDAERINDAFANAAENARSMGELQAAISAAQKAMAPSTNAARDTLSQAQTANRLVGLGEEARAVAEVNAKYAALEAQNQGNTDALIALNEARRVELDTIGKQAAFDKGQEDAKAATAAAKKATDEAQRYAEATRSRLAGIDQTVAAQRMELDVLGQSEGAAAALRFEFQALAAAKQAAAAAGGVVSDAELAKIKEAAAEIGRLTDQLAARNAADSAVDQFFPFEAATREAERLNGYIVDTTNGLSDLQRQALSLQIDQGFIDAAEAAERLRTGGKKAAEDIGTAFLQNVGDVFADIFSQGVRDGESFFSSILRGFAGLGKQLAAAGGKNLISQLFGLPQDKSAAGIGGLIGGAGAAIGSFSGGAGSAFVPTATPAMRATSNALADGVTKAVSGNLLKSVLGAGKSASHIDGLNTRFATALTSMLQAAPDAVRSAVTINSGFRSVARQAELFDAALKKYGSVAAARKWVAPPGNSQHNVGMAADLGYGSGSVKQWVHANAGKYGLAFPLGNEDWHIELAGARSNSGAFRSTSSIDEARAQRKAVSDGVVDANRRMTSGQSGDPWNSGGQNLRQVSPGQQGMTGAQRGLGVLGAGLGIFGAGYDSGSPLSGGLSGALGGYQAATALGFSGLAGGVLGAGLGILGGILGGRAKRKQEHLAKAAEWEKVRPAYEEFDRSLSGEGTGELRSMITGLWGQLEGFMEKGGAAWKYGKGNSSAQFAATGTKMFERWAEEIHEFQDGFQYMLEDLTSGQGLQGAFANGRAQVKKLDEEVKNFIDDVQIAFGSNDIGIPTSAEFDAMSERTKADREKKVAEAKRAAGEYALTMLYTAETQTEVEKALDSFKGTAAGLFPILTKLGWSAEEASKAIDERLTAAIDKMRGDFEKDVADRISDLKGEGYLSEVRDFLKEFETLQADAGRLGADTSNFGDLFKLQLQSIVDGAELTGTAFDDLIKAFPQLAGVVTAFSDTATASTKEIQDAYASFMDQRLTELTSQRADAESALRSEYERTVSFVQSIKDFTADMRLDENLSTLSAADRFTEAQRVYRDTMFKAAGGDKDAQDKLLGSAQDYLDVAKSYYASSEEYGSVFDEVSTTLKGTAAKTETALDVAKGQAKFLADISENTKGLSALMGEYLEALKKEQDQQKLVDKGRTFGANPERNRLIDTALKQVGFNYTGNYGFQADGSDPFRVWREALPPEQLAIVNGIIGQYIGINRQMGGLIPGYANGGIVGNGIWNKDSVLARYAGGGSIGLAGGEMVISAPKVTPQTYPVLDAINRTGRVPGGADDGALLAEVRGLREEVRTLKTVTAQGAMAVKAAVEDGNAIQREGVGEQKRRNAA